MKFSYDNVDSFSTYQIDKIKNLWGSDTEVSKDLFDAVVEINNMLKNVSRVIEEEIEKPKREAAMLIEKARSLKEDMRFTVFHREADLIQSVLGQMSDGYWENNSTYDKFWKNISVEDDDTVVINTNQLKYSSWSETWRKDFEKYFTSAAGVKKFFAKKAMTVFKSDLKDSFDTTSIKGHENEQANYLDSWRDKTVNQTYGEILETINMLNA